MRVDAMVNWSWSGARVRILCFSGVGRSFGGVFSRQVSAEESE